ncbi:uncharacterized protein LOC119089889, partial [Pollicipes pollicipes]|uniref:uncharacterized protein LOC119089889 n=1 Tax=Pollicipes pollicipes TaxID=41117 RepID=UPI001884E552
AVAARAECPWPRDMADLHGSCVCAYNAATQLSVQCQFVDFSRLLGALRAAIPNQELDLLYVTNSTIASLPNNVFANIPVQNIQFSDCDLEAIADGAFSGLESRLRNINLAGNSLTEVPTGALQKLKRLQLVDLSKNRITLVPDDAFKTLSLQTLKLADNNLTVSADAFSGLEKTLKNLNLKGTGLRTLPDGIERLSSLAFLDLAQNSITQLPPRAFAGLESLTALNLERNLIQVLDGTVFEGVNNTLSSLSLLNNLIADFPTEAMAIMGRLRVLDIGFNLLTQLPKDCLLAMRSLTLLALDGNPLSTLPEAAFDHLRATLRGLSLGGRFLTCDCRIRWIARWIRDTDLQVTSRERNPQFCGSPPEFRDRTFYQLNAEEFVLIFKPETFAGAGGAASRSSPFGEEVRVQDAYRRGSAVVIQWESDVPNILGFRVVYRLFGDDMFKQGPPLAPSEKEFKIKNVPSQECIVVCVVSLEDIDISPETVPPRQCREIRTDAAAPTHMDTFVIAASAAICGTIIIAVVVFVCCNRRRAADRKQPLPSVLPATPAPPLASMGTLRGAKDWDQLSMYSHRSIPRARMYHMDSKGGAGRDAFLADEVRSQASRASWRRRSLADGQSLRSYSAMSGHFPAHSGGGAGGPGLALPRPGSASSSRSLWQDALLSDLCGPQHDIPLRRPSASRDRSASRLSSHFTDDTDGWTDHDMDIYMAANATARGSSLVQL